MKPETILLSFLAYTALLFLISFLTSRNSNNNSFFIGNKKSPWIVVAYGMIGATLSGVTFISVPGMVGDNYFSYMVLVLGYILGYLVIIYILLPIYYKFNLTSIYTYLNERFGIYSYKSGASFFLVSRIIGASMRMYIVVMILQTFVFDAWGIDYWFSIALFITLILLYTMQAGIKTIVWTDTLQTTFMLASVIITIFFVSNKMDLSVFELVERVKDSKYSKMWITDWKSDNNYIKQILSGMFITIAMTGLDQDMMQKNLSCKTLRESQKNMKSMSLALIPINLMFLFLGAALFIYAETNSLLLPDKIDQLFPMIAFNEIGGIVGIIFIIGLISAAYSSADSALTSLTTAVSVDFLNIKERKDWNEKKKLRVRKSVHIAMAGVLFLVIMIFRWVNKDSVILELFRAATFTYGPLLGMFAFGIYTKYKIKDKLIPIVVIIAPAISYLLYKYSEILFFGYEFSFELLPLNGLLTFIGLMLIRKKGNQASLPK